MIKQHIVEHINTFIFVQCWVFLIGSAVYGWKNAKGNGKVSKINRLRSSGNYVSKMLFVFALSAGVAWIIDHLN